MFKFDYITKCLMTAGAAIAISVVTTSALASALPTCVVLGHSATQCQSPGNVQIDNAPTLRFQPQYPYWLGPGVHRHNHHR